jgi:hypothetical protein
VASPPELLSAAGAASGSLLPLLQALAPSAAVAIAIRVVFHAGFIGLISCCG